MVPTNAWTCEQAILHFPTVTKPLSTLSQRPLALTQKWRLATPERCDQDMRGNSHLQCEGLSSQFPVFTTPDPTLATRCCEIRRSDSLLLSGSKEGDMLTAPFKSCRRRNLRLRGELSSEQFVTGSPVALTQKWRQLATHHRCVFSRNVSVLCLSAAALAVLMIDDHHWFDRQQRTQEKRILIFSFLKDSLQLWKVNVAEPLFGHAAPVSSHQSLIHCFSVAARKRTCRHCCLMSTIFKANHIGLKPVTKVNRTKCLAEAVKRHFGFAVEFLNGANKCLDVRTSNLALSYCYKAAQHFITAYDSY